MAFYNRFPLRRETCQNPYFCRNAEWLHLANWAEPDALSGEKKVIGRNLPNATFSRNNGLGNCSDDDRVVCVVDFINALGNFDRKSRKLKPWFVLLPIKITH